VSNPGEAGCGRALLAAYATGKATLRDQNKQQQQQQQKQHLSASMNSAEKLVNNTRTAPF